MGLTQWPASGTLYCDSCVVIYTVEAHPRYSTVLDQFLWKEVVAGKLSVITSELSLMETLVGPLKNKNMLLRQEYEQFFRQPELQNQPVSRDIMIAAATLRAKYTLKTPDAIHLATAEAMKCAGFVTNDARLRSKSTVPILVLDEIFSANVANNSEHNP